MSALLSIAGLMLAMGCWTTLGVQSTRDETANFSQYRTWSWLPVVREREGPGSDIERELAALVLKHVRRELSRRHFTYVRENADLGVGVRVSVAREQHVVLRTTAIETLSSLHSSPSFEIQATEPEIVIYERGRLTIRVVDRARDREVWRGECEGRYRDTFVSHMEEVVTNTLESLPAAPREVPPFDPTRLAVSSRGSD